MVNVNKFREIFNEKGFVSLDKDFFVDPLNFVCVSYKPHIVYKNPRGGLNDTDEKVIVVLLFNTELNEHFIFKVFTVNKQIGNSISVNVLKEIIKLMI